MNALEELKQQLALSGLEPERGTALIDAVLREHARMVTETVRVEVLNKAADKLALELTPEQQGAGPGFLLALRLAMRSLRRMADEQGEPTS